MQAVMETAFDILYLCTVCILGITMIRKARGNRMLFLFGIMAVTLGLGDAFHLIPRAYALCTDGLAAHTAALGIGPFSTCCCFAYGSCVITDTVPCFAQACICLPCSAWHSASFRRMHGQVRMHRLAGVSLEMCRLH